MLQVKPLIWIESVIEKHSHSRIEYMIKVGHVCFGLFWFVLVPEAPGRDVSPSLPPIIVKLDSLVFLASQAKSQFKRRSTANNVEIHIPVPTDADSPKFKTTVGSVKWVPENSEIVWSIKSFPVSAAVTHHCSIRCCSYLTL